MDLYYTHLLFFVFCSCSQLSCICILRAGQPVVEQDHASGGVMFSSPAWHFHTVCVWEVFSDGIMYNPPRCEMDSIQQATVLGGRAGR
jgi:hypothetical protein